MPISKTNRTYASRYKTDVSVDQTTNTGFDNTARLLVSGDGASSAASLSTVQLLVKPLNSGTADTFKVLQDSGTTVFTVDTTYNVVKAGLSQVNALTLFKEMGLYEFSPGTLGYHYPLIANQMGMQGAEALTYDNDWGNGTDPATTLDVSGLTDPENAIAVYWYLDNDITLDSVRFLARCDSSNTLNFHLFSYDLDTSSNHGDLSGGVVHANGTVDATATTVKAGTFTLDTANIDANKVVIGFAENAGGTGDFSVSFNIKYHIR